MDSHERASVAVAELKARLSHYLRQVKAGREFVVTERGRVVAQLIPAARSAEQPAKLRELAERGAVRLPSRTLEEAFWDRPRPADPQERLLDALFEERRTGR
jgi:prevent-host-death family protein